MPITSAYLRWLRSHAGHQKIILVRACGIVTDEQGRVLLRRSLDFGWWGLPGGLLEPGERLSTCLVRGMRQKTGLTVEPTRLVGLYTSADFDLTYPNGDQVQQFIACFACQVTGGQWPPDAACFSPTALPDVPAWYRAMLEDHTANAPAASFQRGNPGNPTSREHIRQLRQYVGHARLIMTGGAGLVRDEAGRVLLIRRSDDGEWCLPAGSMELGERVDRAVEREVGEETGLVVRAKRLVGIYAGGTTFGHTYPNGDQVEIVATCFDCQVVGGTLRADNTEALEVRFFPSDGLPLLPKRHLIRIRHGLGMQEAAFFQ
ncbi:MAG: NUDIX domain-containing protein [Chloroflexota bacterium]|nr:NUDIX domain-containing protein [Chloroflexota bacterium]